MKIKTLIFTFIISINSFAFCTPEVSALGIKDIIGDRTPKHLVKPKDDLSEGQDEGSAESLALSVVARIINVTLYFAGSVAVVVLIIGGFRYVTYFGVEEASDNAKKLIINAILGLAIVICSALIIENAGRLIKVLLE